MTKKTEVLKFGTKVTYKSHNGLEHGRVKKLHPNKKNAFVVYNCNEKEWWNYTSQSTKIEDLVIGWITNKDIFDNHYGDHANDKLI